ncbi:MAG: hypothetical protein WAZ14_04615 [Patescibacteria group bacterium]
MMIYVNGQDIARLALGGWSGSAWLHEPQVFQVRPEQYLATFSSWLQKIGLDKQGITGFVIVSGPGSATALRTSHAMVNALALALGVEVMSLDKTEDSTDLEVASSLAGLVAKPFALPTYGRAPTITVSTHDALKRKLE